MKIIGIIPARYKSFRLPGKPLADILGKPMLWHVYQQAIKSKLLDKVYVATDDHRIEEVCNSFDIGVIMTSDTHKTGTDRLSECSLKIDAGIYVNIQGDEPMIHPDAIDSVIQAILEEKNKRVLSIGAFELIDDFNDVLDINVVKVIMSKSGMALSYSRLPIPHSKDGVVSYYKQLGLYAFKKEGLKVFIEASPSVLEKSEGVELFRLLENDYSTRMVEVYQNTISVDTLDDLKKVRLLIEAQEKSQ